MEQLELFNSGDDLSTPTVPKRGFFTRFYGCERCLLLIIGILIIVVGAYSYGIENGKRGIILKENNSYDLAMKNPASATVRPIRPISQTVLQRNSPVVAVQDNDVLRSKVSMPPIDPNATASLMRGERTGHSNKEIDVATVSKVSTYTIQLASYQEKSYAQRVCQALKKKGYSSHLLKKGGYNIVCVGSFNTKEKARSILSQLKKQYRDCYIRRL